ncbi:Crp/Fnr family transcriptional regulator [[Clostridium] fimetarium]|uniref:CRP/FNR family transcriptional regulator, anaerobic regulatory protein n=1 Tax=[Clostridium] fimetarium TaxID=99656 RepID=A0A1I0M7P4_9FIRM|nr:Crp/Fnr family transcriptional regulator [[Clostridium] fimetarium]SEV84128.1 CRP/FNR family transcriptional regulator, anaerobic regulatory protein [[Clostridium] fimetarium]
MTSKLEQELEEMLPFWNKLQNEQKAMLSQRAIDKNYLTGTILHAGSEDCVGLFLIRSGRIRAYIVTEEGKEITLFRLVEKELCIFSASCMMRNISFDIWISAETDVETILIPSSLYSQISEKNIAVANFTNEVVSSRMSDVMWVLEEMLVKSFDKRLAHFLIIQSDLEKTDTLKITHEQIANHLGSAREVVTRMMKYFSEEGFIVLKRGSVKIIDKQGLKKLI